MAKNKYDDMVIFNSPDGPVSNDRRFDREEYEEYLAAKSDEDLPDDDEGVEEGPDYSSLKAAEVKELAKERGLDISGLTKKSEVVKLLEEADAAGETGDDSDEDDDSEDED